MDLGLEGEILRGPECEVNRLVLDKMNNLLFEGTGGWNQRADKRPHMGLNMTPLETPANLTHLFNS